MSEERCPVDNMNLCGIHWHRDKGDVLWNKNKSLIYNWCTIIQQLLMPSIILFKLVKKKMYNRKKAGKHHICFTNNLNEWHSVCYLWPDHHCRSQISTCRKTHFHHTPHRYPLLFQSAGHHHSQTADQRQKKDHRKRDIAFDPWYI